jgi:broad specificity phosphatase PhoE
MHALAIRHAESRTNAGESTDPDAGLTEHGRQQARRLSQRLAGMAANEPSGSPRRFTAVYSSPYRRAIETAEPIAAALDLPIRLRPELCEFHFQSTLDLTNFRLPDCKVLEASFPRVRRDPDYNGDWTWPPLNESLPDLIARQKRLVAHLWSRWTDPSGTGVSPVGGKAVPPVVILIGHGAPIARFVEAWLTDEPGPSYRFVIDNATIQCLRYADGLRSLLALNEASHLLGLRASQFGL